MLVTFAILAALTQNPQPAGDGKLPAPSQGATAAPALQTSAERAAVLAAKRVGELRAALKQPGLKLQEKNKLKKQLLHAAARAREAFQLVQLQALQKEQQAYIDKMMPIWQRQQEMNALFSIEAAKAQALQQMAR
jgi:hypothetical protein